MEFQFDAQQPYQLEAIRSVTELFSGQLPAGTEFELTSASGSLGSLDSQLVELGYANTLTLPETEIYQNLRQIQQRQQLKVTSSAEFSENGLNFTVEMETGTGKTYVYLRTILELNRQYGLRKFVIVVPSIAIREGVLKNLAITRAHFRNLYNNIEYDYFVYQREHLHKLRQFATSNKLQIMVIGIDSFRKDVDEEQAAKHSNVIYKELDQLNGQRPIEFIQSCRPIVIIDEPQSVDNTPKAKSAISKLNPLLCLRYSATHRNTYNSVYQLDPITAYEQGLVKEIQVASITVDAAQGAYVKLEKLQATPRFRAQIRFLDSGGRQHSQWLALGQDLGEVSGSGSYREGFRLSSINLIPGNESLEWSSGQKMHLGEEWGSAQSEIQELMIRRTIETHLQKELTLQAHGIKVLSLFFIDQVAHYRGQGKYLELFEKQYRELAAQERYQSLNLPAVEQVHGGYFSQDRHGQLRDTNGQRKDDRDTYEKIMRDKERLLAPYEPLRFIFSHSALREGWDNPNVFQICTLANAQSTLRKRQELGRGLRICVDQTGKRIYDRQINRLTVIANESYEQFARQLQTEISEDYGIQFAEAKVPLVRRASSHVSITANREILANPLFKDAESRLQDGSKRVPRLTTQTPEILKAISEEIAKIDKISAPQALEQLAQLRIDRHGVQTASITPLGGRLVKYRGQLPNLLEQLEQRTGLTRHTLWKVLQDSERLGEFPENPDRFVREVSQAINTARMKLIQYGEIEYHYEERLPAGKEFHFRDSGYSYETDVVYAPKAPTSAVICDSEIERTFAEKLNQRTDVLIFAKLPSQYRIPTPMGYYNPDWLVIQEKQVGLQKFIYETKGDTDWQSLRPEEMAKIQCGIAFYKDTGFNYKAINPLVDQF